MTTEHNEEGTSGGSALTAGSGLTRMEQLLAFCDWEREHNPHPNGKPHIAEWAAAEIERLSAELAEIDALRERMADILSRTAVALRGPEPSLTRWSWHDLPERAAEIKGNSVSEMREVVEFLCGTGELCGVTFGDIPEGERGKYWWRKHLRAALQESEEKMTGRLPQFIRRDVERAIEAAINPRGMGVHDGKALIGADRLQYMLALIDQTRKPENSSAKQKYDELMKDCEETSPIERLRFYCSVAMSGQDWLDVEPFIDALQQESEAVAKVTRLVNCSIIDSTGYKVCWQDLPDGTELFLTPPSATAIEAAAYVRAAEIAKKYFTREYTLNSPENIHEEILALTTQDGRTALEEFGVDLLRRTLKQLDSCVIYPGSVNELRAIVNQVMKEVGK